MEMMDIHKVLKAMGAVESYIRYTHWVYRTILGPREFEDWVESLAGEAVALANKQIDRWDRKHEFSCFAILKVKELLRRERIKIKQANQAKQSLIIDCRETPTRDEFGQYLLRDELKGVLELLTFEQRAVVALRYLCGCNATETARILNSTEDAVHSILYRARERCREFYRQMYLKPPLEPKPLQKPKPPPPTPQPTSHRKSQRRTS